MFWIEIITLDDLSNPGIFKFVPLPITICSLKAFVWRCCKPTQIPGTMFSATTSVIELFTCFFVPFFTFFVLSAFWTFFGLWTRHQGLSWRIFCMQQNSSWNLMSISTWQNKIKISLKLSYNLPWTIHIPWFSLIWQPPHVSSPQVSFTSNGPIFP